MLCGCASLTFTYEPTPPETPYLVIEKTQYCMTYLGGCEFSPGVYKPEFRSVQNGKVLAIYYRAPQEMYYSGTERMYIPRVGKGLSGSVAIGDNTGTYEGGIVRYVSPGAKVSYGRWVRLKSGIERAAAEGPLPLEYTLVSEEEAKKLTR